MSIDKITKKQDVNYHLLLLLKSRAINVHLPDKPMVRLSYFFMG